MKLATNIISSIQDAGRDGKSAAVKSLEQLSRHIKMPGSTTSWSFVKVYAWTQTNFVKVGVVSTVKDNVDLVYKHPQIQTAAVLLCVSARSNHHIGPWSAP